MSEAARLSAIVTHGHAEAVSGALLQAHAVYIVLNKPEAATDPRLFLTLLAATSPSPVPTLSAKLAMVGHLLEIGVVPAEAARRLGTSTLAVESVPAALWAFLTANGSFREAVVNAALLGGDVDTICTMVGALAGALHGAVTIPPTWLENLANEKPSVPELLSLADDLGAMTPRHLLFPAA